jgi:perosamine synthetase
LDYTCLSPAREARQTGALQQEMNLVEMSSPNKIPWAKPALAGREKEYVEDAFLSSWISGGPYVERFEREFASSQGMPYALAVSSGTAALYLALRALGIGPGDEVIVPGFTFAAPVNMVMETGAVPVYADVDASTWCLSPASAEENITSRTKAILAVHLYGNVCAMEALRDLAGRSGFFIVEDAAQAAFSRYKGRCAGAWGDIGCFSFHATKTIAMGEGGCVLTSNENYHARMRTLRDHGMSRDKRYWHDVRGYNFRLTDLQAAVGCAQLERIEDVISRRRRIYGWYRGYLRDARGITWQAFHPETEPVVWTLALKLDPAFFKGDRDFVMSALSRAGIETRPGFYPFSVMPLYKAPSLPVAREVAGRVICLPFYPDLLEEQVAFICGEIKKLTV